MLKKILLISLVLCLALSTMTAKCLAGPLEQLEQAKDNQEKGYFSQAKGLYEQIIAENPGSDYAFKAYEGLAFLYIRNLQTEAAAQTISRLTSDYSTNPDLPKVLCSLARESARRRAYGQAKSIYEQVRQQFSGSTYAAEAVLNIPKVDILFQIESSRYAEADTAVSRLASDFSGNSDLPDALLDIADRYSTKRKYKEARQIYQLIVQQYPNASCVEQARLDIARVDVMALMHAGFDEQADATIDKLCEDFATNPGLPRVLARIAGRYRGAAKYDKAIGVFQKLIERYPDSSEIDEAQLNIARCNVLSPIQKGKYVESSAALDQMTADYPGRLGLRGALNEIASRYEQAQQKGLAQQAYNKIITFYPGSTSALNASKQLIFMQIKAGQLTEAQQATAQLSLDFAGHFNLPQVTNHIARRFREQGEYLKAEILYQQAAQLSGDIHEVEEAQLNVPLNHIVSLIDTNDHGAAFAAIETLIADFNTNWHLPWALSWLADRYHAKALNLVEQKHSDANDYFQKAITLYEKAEYVTSDAAADARAIWGLGNCYRQKADYEKAQQTFAKVVNDYSGTDFAWHALYLSALSYEDMGKAGSIDQQEALNQAKAAYQRLLQEYPNCRVAATAQDWLSRNASN